MHSLGREFPDKAAATLVADHDTAIAGQLRMSLRLRRFAGDDSSLPLHMDEQGWSPPRQPLTGRAGGSDPDSPRQRCPHR